MTSLSFPRGLIVSCQAREGEPLRDSRIIAALAQCAEIGGAVALRINGPEDIKAVREVCKLPIIGINKYSLYSSVCF